ncbi:MAG: SGNH/GDSL hydrolase family protein [Bacilli bacterium]|nr:SGNH/GDSL hydrolase family protein [Bacilli bacterium]
MVTEPSEFRQRLLEIQNSVDVVYTALPSDEPRFIIDANSRTINIPIEFQFLGVKNDHNAETVYFEIDRYFDDEDLSQHTCVVQFSNKNNSNDGGIYPVTTMDTTSVDGKIIFGWEIKSDATSIVGDIYFSVRFYSINTTDYIFTYNFNTLTAKSSILDTHNVDNQMIIENYPSELDAWTAKMDELSRGTEGKVEEIEAKGQEVLTEINSVKDSIPEDYSTLSSDVNELKGDLADYKIEISRDYSNDFPNFRKSLVNGNPMIVFVGDSWTAGQGATDTGANSVIGMTTPDRTDGFHTPANNSGKFVDRIARTLKEYYPLNMKNYYIRCDNQQTRTYTGSWKYDTSENIPEVEAGARAYSYTLTVGDKAVIKCASNHLKLRVLRSSYGGKATIRARVNDGSDIITDAGMENLWKPLSEIIGINRLDNYSNIDELDLYQPSVDYTGFFEVVMPYGKLWEFEFTIVAKNPSAQNGVFGIGCDRYDNNFINAGRGNHTTADYLGIKVGAGAGMSGSAPYGDNTDHIAEVIALNPSLIIFEPMIINDWFHGLNLAHSRDCIEEMIVRLKETCNCDIIALMPGPVVTVSTPWDYSGSVTPVADNPNGKGTYNQYYNNALWILKKHQIPVINTYQLFVDEYNSENHENWTIGEEAGRIHVNQHGHDIIVNSFIEKSGFADKLI